MLDLIKLYIENPTATTYITGGAVGFVVLTLPIVFFVLRRRSSADSEQRRQIDRGQKIAKKDRKVYQQAMKMIKNGHIVGGAQLLESIGQTRDAISTLEKYGRIDEAANTLLRMGLPNRAGVVYTRHGLWEKAAKCFQLANMPLEVARCMREGNDLRQAARLFVKAEHYAEAADCFNEIEDYSNAAKYHAKVGNHKKSISLYEKVIETGNNIANIQLEPYELDVIVEHVAAGEASVEFADMLAAHDRLAETVIKLLKRNKVDAAAAINLRSTKDISDELVAAAEKKKEVAEKLVEVFSKAGNYQYVGMLHEKLHDYADAGYAYERSEDFDKAAECYGKVGDTEKYEEMLERKNKPATPAPEDLSHAPNRDQGGNEESTAMVSAAPSHIPTNPPMEAPQEVSNEFASEAPEDLPSPTFSMEVSNEFSPAAPVDLPPPPSLSGPEQSNEGASHVPPPQPFSTQPQETENNFNETKVDSDPRFASNPLFAGLEQHLLFELWDVGEAKSFAMADLIPAPGGDLGGIYFVESGGVKGEQGIIFQAGEIFGIEYVLTGTSVPFRMAAIDQTKARYIPFSAFEALMETNPTSGRTLYKNLAQILLKKSITTQNNKAFPEAG